MLISLQSKFKKHPILLDLSWAILFGLLSLLFGALRFKIPGVEGGYSDFREIPLIVSVFYIHNPIFLIISVIITSIELDANSTGSVITTFVMHIFPVFIAWVVYKYMNKQLLPLISKGFFWMAFVVIYYWGLLIPIMIMSDQYLEINNSNFLASYVLLVDNFKFEMIATALITSLYLVQIENRKSLRNYGENLEQLVSIRTKELASANEKLVHLNGELKISSDEIKSMNSDLDGIVKERSKKIEEQLALLIKYAHMNSHEVRAPLARVLGLLEIIKLEKSVSKGDKVVKELCESGLELDEIVRKMNRMLENEID